MGLLRVRVETEDVESQMAVNCKQTQKRSDQSVASSRCQAQHDHVTINHGVFHTSDIIIEGLFEIFVMSAEN